MSAMPPKPERSQIARPDKNGSPTFNWALSDSSITDTVKLVAGPFNVLPIVFVPGIMGSNIKSTESGKPVWRLDAGVGGVPWGLLSGFATQGPGARQKLLHPKRTVVDDGGAIPKVLGGSVHDTEDYRRRGSGTVGEGSYHEFLLWLEQQLNPSVRNPAYWTDYFQDEATIGSVLKENGQPKLHPGIRMGMKGQPFGTSEKPFSPLMTDDLIARGKLLFPVYAAGYNWLDSNRTAAALLREKILSIIKENNLGNYRCEQVILVTHSMGGLVARACAQLPEMDSKIAGVVHGVMPAVGAAVAYRRCKIGMKDEDFGAGLVIGSTGQEVTAVFAQAPGALQLLPSQTYSANWMRVQGPDGGFLESLPLSVSGKCDAYGSIYSIRDRWWGLVNEDWLAPSEGQPISWDMFIKNVNYAKDFHAGLIGSYHANTYVYYGADGKQKSFEKVTWTVKPGLAPDKQVRPALASVKAMGAQQVRMDGATPEFVGGKTEVATYMTPMGGGATFYDTSYWELHFELQDGIGDGTVPASSGAAPAAQGGGNIQQQFKLTGFGHEPAFRNGVAQKATLYAISKIAGKAKMPA